MSSLTATTKLPSQSPVQAADTGVLVGLGAAVVALLDPGMRRFYTCWFTPELSKHSPALSLIYEITRRSLAADMDCDYMTGEQPYKLRLATSAVQLLQLRATAGQLAALAQPAVQELRLAG